MVEMENIYMPKDNQYLYQILDVTTSDATYPYCKNCYKKINRINKKWVCSCCNEEYNQISFRFKLSLEVSDFDSYKCVSIFGNKLDAIFGMPANQFYEFIKENSFDKENLKEAFSYCLINQWVLFEFEKSSFSKKTHPVVSKFKVLDINFVTVYGFLKRQSEAENIFDSSFDYEFEEHLESVIDATVNEENLDCLCSVLESLTADEKKISTATPLFNRLRQKRKK